MTIDQCTVIGYGAPLTDDSVSALCNAVDLEPRYYRNLQGAEHRWEDDFPDVLIHIINEYGNGNVVYAMVNPHFMHAHAMSESVVLPADIFARRFEKQLEAFLRHYGLEAARGVEPLLLFDYY